MFNEEIFRIVKHGLRCNYESKTENLNVFKGKMKFSEQIISVLSPNYDITHLYSLVFEALSNKEHCEKIWKIHNMRMQKPKEKHT